MERANTEKASGIKYRMSETPRHSRTRPRIRHTAGRSLTIVPPSRRRGHSTQRPENRSDLESSAMDKSNQWDVSSENDTNNDKKKMLEESADRERTMSDGIRVLDKKSKREARGSSPSQYEFVTYEDSVHNQDNDADKLEDLLDDIDSVASGGTTRIDLESIPRGGTTDNYKGGDELCGNISESESIVADSPRSHSQSPRGRRLGNLSCCEQMAEFCCMVSGGRLARMQSRKKEFPHLVRQGDLKNNKISANNLHTSGMEIGEKMPSLTSDFVDDNAKQDQFCILM